MFVHAHFTNGPLDGTAYSSDSANPQYAALARLAYTYSDSFHVGSRIRFSKEAIASARDADVVKMLPLFLSYFVLRSSYEQDEIRAWFYHIPAVG